MKISKEQIENEAVTLAEAIQRLRDTDAKNLYVVLQKLGKEGYLIPMSFAPLLVGSQSQGKLYEQDPSGYQRPERIFPIEDIPLPGVVPQVVVPATERWKVVGIEGQYLVDATVIARTCSLLLENDLMLPLVNSLYTLNTTGIVLTASQDGQENMFANNMHYTTDDGIRAIVADENPLPMLVEPGSTILCGLANFQALDQAALRVYYVKYLV